MSVKNNKFAKYPEGSKSGYSQHKHLILAFNPFLCNICRNDWAGWMHGLPKLRSANES
ncbi:unnamed protein product, partial [Ceratitis capitata]